MAAVKKIRRNMNDVDRRETLLEFSIAVFSGSAESQSVGNVPFVSGTRVAELNFLTEAFDCGCCAEPLLS